jgi:hypothetical protein
MADEKVTKPTIETVLKRIGALEERFGIRLDRIESVANTTRGEMLELRADFREMRMEFHEMRAQIKERFPALN